MFPIQDVLPDPHKRSQNEPVIGGDLNHVKCIGVESFGVMLVS